MHGEQETSRLPRSVWAVAHLGFLVAAAALLLRPAAGVPPARAALLIAFGGVMWLRMAVTAFVFLRRRFGWSEMAGTAAATFLYQVGFAWLAARRAAPLDGWDALAVALFALGSAMNSGAEWQRRRFKARPENRGRLYTGGLWRRVRHVNYLGDVVWVSGWALATHHPWAMLVPPLLLAMFAFAMVPDLERYLERRYGADFRAWRQRSWALVPGLW